jgi:hypothetical protein
MDPAEFLAKLPVKPVGELLAALADACERSDDPAAPRLPSVILHLRGGRDLSGRIVRLSQDAGRGRTLLVQCGGFSGMPDGAAYVPADSVEAVTVLNPETCADLLSGGALPAPAPSNPAPTRLEILRAAKERGEALARERGAAPKLDVEAEPGLSDDGLRSLSFLVKDVFAALTETSADALGREALARVKSVRIANAPAADVRLSDGRLEILAALTRGRDGRPSKSDLKTRFAALL